ncbi:MAG: LuxR C-terminal-related transcriptional regulator [bacterium]|nr:LuxR C-terminal-related transcriptional regulator [bacterium]
MERTIFILDDDAGVRDTLRTLLEAGGYKGVCFADEAGLLEATRQRCPLAILLDVNLPGRSGLEILKDLATYAVPVVMISDQGDVPTVVESMRNGALDFLEKPFKCEDILGRLANIRTGVAGNRTVALQQKISSLNFPGREPLTRRERDVLQLAATGCSNKEVAEKLGISYRTVEDHRSNIMHKLGLKNIAELLITVLK